MANLPRLCALQSLVFTDRAEDLLQDVDPEDVASIAKITLPIESESRQAVIADQEQRCFTISSENMNLRLLGLADTPAQPGGHAFGFVVGLTNSVLQVGHWRDRYFCRDGHHRAFHLIRRGITTVPALVREFESFAELAPTPNLLPEAVCSGSNPPLLQDFFDEEVSAEVWQPATRRVITISAVEAVVA